MFALAQSFLEIGFLHLDKKFETATHSAILVCVSQGGQERLNTVVKDKA